MGPARTVFLMYHELEVAGRKPCQTDPGYLRYVIPDQDFRAQLAHLRSGGFQGVSVGEALGGCPPRGPRVALTFDDGCETDLLTAAPLLEEAGFNATFYVVAGFVGREGYLDPVQLRELSGRGFEIGCHSMTHPYLPDLDGGQMRVEIGEAKQRLEQVLGRQVDHFSCPGGRWSRRVARVAREAGYRSVATSRVGTNAPGSDPYSLARVAVRRGTPLGGFDRLVRARGQWLRQVQDQGLALVKGWLGNAGYEKVRAAVLGRGRERGKAGDEGREL
jgi:peptidoglycan/xylan/chitin deacetylase (PgdA/CDA1 family)